MPMVKTTVYVSPRDKARLEELAERTGVQEARLWREALHMLLEKRSTEAESEQEEALVRLREKGLRLDIGRAYRSQKEEERRLEAETD